jgi:hypothetical protein
MEETTSVLPACPVCKAKGLGAAKIKDCHLGKTTPYIVAVELGCTYEEVMRHINEGHELSVDANGCMQSTDELLNKLMKNMNTLDEWSSYIIETVNKPSDVDRAKVQMMVQLTQEIRKTIESIAVLQGRVGNGDAAMQINALNTRVIDLTNTVVDNCCSDCKMKILAAMERPKVVQEAQFRCLPVSSK